MASEAETRKSMSDFGIKGKHLQDMVTSFTGAKKDEKSEDKTPSRSERRYGGKPFSSYSEKPKSVPNSPMRTPERQQKTLRDRYGTPTGKDKLPNSGY